jgi:hypothetical protein
MIDRRSVLSGAGLALFVVVPVIAVAAIVGTDKDSNVNFFFYLPVVFGLVFGGWGAARLRADAPLAHGSLAALGAYLLVAVIITVIRLADGRQLNVAGLVFNGFIAASAGIFGGVLATRRRAPG